MGRLGLVGLESKWLCSFGCTAMSRTVRVVRRSEIGALWSNVFDNQATGAVALGRRLLGESLGTSLRTTR